jgi:DNA replication protein DnaC
MTRTRSMTEQAAGAAIDTACRVLRLPTIRAGFADATDKAERDQLSYRGFLAELFMAECEDRDHRRAERQLHAAGFPRQKWLSDFDFDANPAINAALVNTLASCDWVRKGQPLCLIGDSGTGKSHLLIALGTAAAMAGFRVRYTLAAKLANELAEAATTGSSPRRSPATAVSTCCASTSSATWNSTGAAPNSSSRYSPKERRKQAWR